MVFLCPIPYRPVTDLAYEENSMGRFLKDQGKLDKTKAGKMMVAVGKSMSYSGQQRLSIRTPLVRLYQEVETFHDRAIEDTEKTVKRMEKVARDFCFLGVRFVKPILGGGLENRQDWLQLKSYSVK